jgi:hypothetical protein
LLDLESDYALGSCCLRGFEEVFFSQEVVKVASEMFLLHLLASSRRTASHDPECTIIGAAVAPALSRPAAGL